MCPTTHIIHMVKIDLVLFQSSSGLKITRLHETILGLSQHKFTNGTAGTGARDFFLQFNPFFSDALKCH